MIICIANIVKVFKDPQAIDAMVALHESEEDDIVEKFQHDEKNDEETKK